MADGVVRASHTWHAQHKLISSDSVLWPPPIGDLPRHPKSVYVASSYINIGNVVRTGFVIFISHNYKQTELNTDIIKE